MLHDRLITITVGNSRKSQDWRPQTLLLSELYNRLQSPERSTETMQEYLSLKKAEQDAKKDVGGFVAGSLRGPRRKAANVQSRDIITLDLDTIPPGETSSVLERVDALGCGYCIYSTRKHAPTCPRLRVLLPIDRAVTADEYEPMARYAAEHIGMEFADPTTFEPARLMYWPSCCKDGEYVFVHADRPMLSADGLLLAMDDEYGSWKDMARWPQIPGTEKAYKRLSAKQADPLSKKGIVGAFCRAYDIPEAIHSFLEEVYTPADDSDRRFTYKLGSTTGGAVVYDNGLFLYSHHATDPCHGCLVNAFDLVRLHRFGALDDDAPENTPTNRRPSYIAMCKLALQDTKVTQQLAKERADVAVSEFSGIAETAKNDEKSRTDWATGLELNNQGAVKATIDNAWIILENDPNLRGKFALNEFAGRGEVLGDLPWGKFVKRRAWTDNDSQGLYWYFEKVYKISGNGKIDGALSLHSERHKFNDVRNYLQSLSWDGHPRLDKLLVEYLGATDTPYTRAVTRKAFTAAVARAMTPGCKYDTMLILSGPQGIGKSTLLDKMSRGWFNDGIRTFEGKEASELLQGVWIVEIGELDAFRQTDVSRIKQFLSLRADRFRAAYGRHVKDIPRCCVFFGTTNNAVFLQDRTGNRRFWPVDVGIHPREKTVWDDLDKEVDQLWAEAVMRWRAGESLFLVGELEKSAQAEQEAHREVSSKEGIILDYIERPIPEDWQKWSLEKRRLFMAGGIKNEESLELMVRDRVCALEIWCEAFGGSPKDFRYRESTEINEILRAQPGWVRTSNGLRFGYCGYQRGFLRSRKH